MPKIYLAFADDNSPSPTVAPWSYNTFLGADGSVTGVIKADLIDDTNSSTGYGLTAVQRLTIVNNATIGTNSTIFPDAIYLENWAGGNSATGIYNITGLSAGDLYTIDGVQQTYSLGSTSNVAAPRVFLGVVGASGVVEIEAVSTSGSGIAYLSGITIDITGSPLQVDDTTDPLVTGTTATLNGTGFEASQDSGSVIRQQGAVSAAETISTWSDTSIDVNSLTVEGSSFKYGLTEYIVTNNSGDIGNISFEASPISNEDYVDISSLAFDDNRLTALPDLSVDDQVRYQSVLHQGGLPTAYDVILNPDATFTIDGLTPNGSYTFEVVAWDHTDSTWGLPVNQDVTISTTATVECDIIEGGPLFTESIDVSVNAFILSASITEQGPSFVESISASIPISINAKKIIRVR